MQEKYKQPLESSEPAPSSVSEKEIEAYNQYLADAKSRSDLAKRKSEVYQEQTSNFFNPEFKSAFAVFFALVWISLNVYLSSLKTSQSVSG